MIKNVLLKLTSVKYSGKSIGDDIRVEIDCMGVLFAKNYEIKRGTTRKLDEEIEKFPAYHRSLNIPIVIRVIERDKIFNDVGFVSFLPFSFLTMSKSIQTALVQT